jgi:hypothetical protein
MHLSKVNNALEHRIAGGSEFQWSCWPDARYIDFESDFAHASVVFNSRTQEVYSADVSVKREMWHTDSAPYRWLNPTYKQQYVDEAQSRGVDYGLAWDNTVWTDLEVEEDWLEKAAAMFKGDEWDTRIQVPIDLPDHELLELMMMAHRQDKTFNNFVTEILEQQLEKLKYDLNR